VKDKYLFCFVLKLVTKVLKSLMCSPLKVKQGTFEKQTTFLYSCRSVHVEEMKSARACDL